MRRPQPGRRGRPGPSRAPTSGRDLGRGAIAVCRRVPAAEAREPEDGVDGGFERAGVALNLGEDEAALERGEEGDGEVVRVGAVREMPGGVKTAQPVADDG